MTGSIGQLADELIREVKTGKLVKLAEHQIVKEAESKVAARTELGNALLKLGAALRSKSGTQVSMHDLTAFLSGIKR
jgi:hypothetical protein